MIKTMTYSEYAEQFVNSDSWSTLADEMHWEGGLDAELCARQMIVGAVAADIHLTGEEEFDYQSFFYNAYINTEKGLS